MSRRSKEEQEPDRSGPARVPARAGAEPAAPRRQPPAAAAAPALARRAAQQRSEQGRLQVPGVDKEFSNFATIIIIYLESQLIYPINIAI